MELVLSSILCTLVFRFTSLSQTPHNKYKLNWIIDEFCIRVTIWTIQIAHQYSITDQFYIITRIIQKFINIRNIITSLSNWLLSKWIWNWSLWCNMGTSIYYQNSIYRWLNNRLGILINWSNDCTACNQIKKFKRLI